MRTLLSSVLLVVIAALAMPTSAFADTAFFQHGFNGYFHGKDVHLEKNNPNTNFGSHLHMSAGFLGHPLERHILIRFDGIIGNGPGQIPLGSTINSAGFGFSMSSASVPVHASIHEMLIPWFEHVATWNNMLGGIDNAPLGEYDPTPSHSGFVGIPPIHVAPIVQHWANGAANWGFAILPTGLGHIGFESNEGPVVAQRPYLQVNFTPPEVPEPTTATLLTAATTCALGAARRHRPNSSI